MYPVSSLIFLTFTLTRVVSTSWQPVAASAFALHEREAMESLSSELLAILESNSTLPRLGARETDISQSITDNANSLDAIGAQSNEASVTAQIRSSLACKAGKIIFGAHAVMPEDSTYTGEKEENWSTACWLPAACFWKVQSSIEVAIALKIVTFTKAKFAVRGGGHNANRNFASIDRSGILIDLGDLSSITLSADKKFVSIGSGNTWDKVYAHLEQQQLTVVGGRVKGVGVGGLYLGGGMSHFSNHWGLSADNLKNVEIVLADSTITQINSTHNADLFKAIKGGGPNFGIVTRYDAYTYPDYKVWYTLKVYDASNEDIKERVLKATVQIENAMTTDDRIGFFLSVGTTTLTAGLLYRGTADYPAAFEKAFGDIPVMFEAIPPTNGTQFTLSNATAIDTVATYETGALTVKPNAKLYSDLHSTLVSLAKAEGVTLAYTHQPLGAPAVEKGKAKGGNVANIPAETQSWLGFISMWSDPGKDAVARSQIRELIDRFEGMARTQGHYLDFKFQNDANSQQSPLRTYGADNLAYLKTVANKYDPRGVFQKLQNDGFLLSKV